MTDTPNLTLPLLQPAQAQKHVTVNEALTRIDGLAQLVLQSATATTPPGDPQDGLAWAVPSGASGDWWGEDGRIALRLNGGWAFVPAQAGWRAWLVDSADFVVHDGVDWVPAVALGGSGAATVMRVITHDHTIVAGTDNYTSPILPERAVVFAVTGRVTQAIGGSLSAWQLGSTGPRTGTGRGLAWARDPGSRG